MGSTEQNSNLPAPVQGGYAEQLDTGFPLLKFSQGLELEYRQHHLTQSRRLIGLSLALGVAATALAVGRGLSWPLPGISGTTAGTALIWLFWPGLFLLVAGVSSTRFYQNSWLVLAPIVLVALGIPGAYIAAQSVAAGHYHAFALLLAALPLLHFCSGLLVRQLAFVWLPVMVAYFSTLVMLGASSPVLRFEGALIAVVTSIGLFARYSGELAARRSYLQHKVLLEFGRRDPLTGLQDRYAFDKAFDRIWRQAARDAKPVGLILLNIDGFAAYNTAAGHEAGNRVLVRLAAILDRKERRALDMAARLSGGEFAMMLYGARPDYVADVAHTLLDGLRECAIPNPAAGNNRMLTASVGVASQTPDDFGNPDGLKLVAEAALDDARRAGGDSVECRIAGYRGESPDAILPTTAPPPRATRGQSIH